jgi:putative transposase
MSEKYKIHDHEKAYFVTMTVTGWIDVFSRKSYKLKIVESLTYCQKNKGLEIFGWCLMSNHLHMIVKAVGHQTLPEIHRDFKKFTSKAIIKMINEQPESRREWMLKQFEYRGKLLKRIKNYKFWQDGNHAEIIFSPEIFYQKLDYIHNNPVKDMIVSVPEEYIFSSARNYSARDYMLEIVMETPQLKTVR